MAICNLIWLPSSTAIAMTLREAVEKTLNTNPSVLAARLNRRAETRAHKQAKGRLLPRVTVDADIGREAVDRPNGFAADVNDTFRRRRQAGFTVRQILFNGWERANDIYRSGAIVDASALRVLASSESLALAAIEAYIDVNRNRVSVSIARRNVARHQDILTRIRALRKGGKAGRGEVDQILERLAGAKAALESVRLSLLQAEARFRRVVGAEPTGLRTVGYPKDFKLDRAAYVEMGLHGNPEISTATAKADAAMYYYRQSRGEYFPEISLEFNNSYGEDLDGTPGQSDKISGKVVLKWNIFDGFIRKNRASERAERWGQAVAERDNTKREIVEQIEKSFAAYHVGSNQVRILRDRLDETRKVVRTYEEEYRLSKRTLVDLLDAESTKFNTEIQLTSVKAVNVFAAFQLLGSTGKILDTMNLSPPPEADLDFKLSLFSKSLIQKKSNPFNVEMEPLKK